MNPRGGRWGPRWRGSELKVKEVIMPVKNDQESAEPTENISKCQKNVECTPHNIIHTSLKIGDHEINTLYELVALKKPPLEDFVLETFHPEYETVNESSSEQNFEEKQKLKWKIKKYEETMLHQHEYNCWRQRQLEKQTLEQQENLAETWLGLIQRREELKKKNLDVLTISPPFHRGRCYCSPIDISLASKKYWKDETDEQILKKCPEAEKIQEKGKGAAEKKARPVALEGLEDEFYEKLVFVDDSDDISD